MVPAPSSRPQKMARFNRFSDYNPPIHNEWNPDGNGNFGTMNQHAERGAPHACVESIQGDRVDPGPKIIPNGADS
jgi:hypothetical protein